MFELKLKKIGNILDFYQKRIWQKLFHYRRVMRTKRQHNIRQKVDFFQNFIFSSITSNIIDWIFSIDIKQCWILLIYYQNNLWQNRPRAKGLECCDEGWKTGYESKRFFFFFFFNFMLLYTKQHNFWNHGSILIN